MVVYRKRFRELEDNANLLISVRENANAVVSEWEIPWEPIDELAFQKARRKDYVPVEYDDSDVPF